MLNLNIFLGTFLLLPHHLLLPVIFNIFVCINTLFNNTLEWWKNRNPNLNSNTNVLKITGSNRWWGDNRKIPFFEIKKILLKVFQLCFVFKINIYLNKVLLILKLSRNIYYYSLLFKNYIFKVGVGKLQPVGLIWLARYFNVAHI